MSLALCVTCGTQYDVQSLSSCKICDDPRQYVPLEGQSWTTLETLQEAKKHKNVFTPDPHNASVVGIRTQPPFAISQRAFLLLSPKGNVLWDCISYLDQDTIDYIKSLGGLSAVVVSHPHYFSTTCEWGAAFDCPVYLSAEDTEWVARKTDHIKLWPEKSMTLAGGDFIAVKAGGHFPGSSVLNWVSQRKLFVGDTMLVSPSGVYHIDRLPGTVSFSFMWSYPNMIPLPPDDVYNIWKAVKHLEFDDVHAAFNGKDARGNARARVLESAKLYIQHAGYVDHAIHQETIG